MANVKTLEQLVARAADQEDENHALQWPRSSRTEYQIVQSLELITDADRVARSGTEAEAGAAQKASAARERLALHRRPDRRDECGRGAHSVLLIESEATVRSLRKNPPRRWLHIRKHPEIGAPRVHG
jgi:hypothetical protein